MGVKLKDIVEPKNISFKDLEGRSVSIDAFNTLYQFLSTIRQRDGQPLCDENGDPIAEHYIQDPDYEGNPLLLLTFPKGKNMAMVNM